MGYHWKNSFVLHSCGSLATRSSCRLCDWHLHASRNGGTPSISKRCFFTKAKNLGVPDDSLVMLHGDPWRLYPLGTGIEECRIGSKELQGGFSLKHWAAGTSQEASRICPAIPNTKLFLSGKAAETLGCL